MLLQPFQMFPDVFTYCFFGNFLWSLIESSLKFLSWKSKKSKCKGMNFVAIQLKILAVLNADWRLFWKYVVFRLLDF